MVPYCSGRMPICKLYDPGSILGIIINYNLQFQNFSATSLTSFFQERNLRNGNECLINLFFYNLSNIEFQIIIKLQNGVFINTCSKFVDICFHRQIKATLRKGPENYLD